MKIMNFKNRISVFVCLMLVAIMSFLVTGCKDKSNTTNNTNSTSDKKENTVSIANKELPEKKFDKVLGTGKIKFAFAVIDDEGNKKTYQINTDQQIVSEALLEVKLIDGEIDSTGIIIETVDGITASYDINGKYWVFYEDENRAQSGINRTIIDPSVLYSLRVEGN